MLKRQTPYKVLTSLSRFTQSAVFKTSYKNSKLVIKSVATRKRVNFKFKQIIKVP